MTRKTVLLLTGCLAAVGAAAAFAATGDAMGPKGDRHGRHGWHHGGMHHMGGPRAMHLKALDVDADGDVTLAEFLKPHEERFAKLDTDNSGFLDSAKLTTRFKARSDERIDGMIKRLDANGDGKVSLAEFLESGRGHGWGKRHHGPGGRHGGWRHGGMGGMGGMSGPTGDGASDARQTAAAEGPGMGGEEPGNVEPGTPPGPGWHGRHEGRRGWGRQGGRHQSMESRIERFKSIDKNADGFIDKAEFQAASGEEIAYRAKRMMHDLDANKDGKITKDEFLAPAKQRFARMDIDDNGKITSDDLPPRMRQMWATKK
jgi:Ca2+-binding EF-hand superfamily protein